MEKEEILCINYAILVNNQMVGPYVKAKGKDEYSAIIPEIPHGSIIIVKALGPKNRETKTNEKTIY